HHCWQVTVGFQLGATKLSSDVIQYRLRQFPKIGAAEDRVGGLDGSIPFCRSVDQRRDVVGQRPLRTAELGHLASLPFKFDNLFLTAVAEYLEVLNDLFVLSVQEELVKGVRRGHRRVEPDCPGFGLAELTAIRLGDQRCSHGMYPSSLDTPDELNPGSDIPPLIAATELQRAAV